jgi:hypothetical protein
MIRGLLNERNGDKKITEKRIIRKKKKIIWKSLIKNEKSKIFKVNQLLQKIYPGIPMKSTTFWKKFSGH